MAANKKTTKKTSTKKKSTKKTVTLKKTASKKKAASKKKTSKKTTKASAAKKKTASKKKTSKKTTKASAAKKKAASKKTTKASAAKKKAASKKTTKASAAKKKAASKKKTTKASAAKKKTSSKKTTKASAAKKTSSKKTTKAKPAAKKTASKKASAAKAAVKTTAKNETSAQTAAREFSAFGPRLIEFLVELGMNNDKAWFTENKGQYEAAVREPARAFIRTMGPGLAAISSEFVANDKKVGGSLMRVYRDVRFSKDKTPYKTNVGIHFRHKVGKDAHAPGLYVHIAPGQHFVGVGMWRPDKDALAAIRKRIVEDTDAWIAATQSTPFSDRFELGGESLSRPPKGFDKEHPMLADLKRKDHIAISTVDEGMMLGDGIVDHILGLFEAASPYMAFQCQALGISF